MISFRNFSLRRGQRLLLSQMDIALHAGWRVGVVGRNGCGKSSLFAALMGELEPDAGDLDLPARVRIASVAQETPALPDSALDFVLSGDAEVANVLRAEADAMTREDFEAVAQAHQRLAEMNGYDAPARAGRLLHGLGFTPDTHDRAVSTFSGGWRVRLNLARALMMPSDLLLLDEPTNHLDLDAVLWLEQWLLKYPGTLLVISHDREFLDGISTHTLHLHEGRAKLYSGDYTSFERQRAEQLRQQQIAFEKEQVERAHLQKFIDRFKAKASKARQAQSRMKRLEKLAGTEAVRAERALHIAFGEPLKLPTSLIRIGQGECGYHGEADGGPLPILRGVGFGLESGDRIGLLGPNGAGKSTLVKSLVGELPLLAGERNAHPDLRIGYFAQHTVESLREGASPINHLQDIAPGESQQAFRDFLGRWNFPGDRAFESVDGFSGGERARLALALIAWQRPNVLLLDEPTNHLDLDMREALAEALSDFPGAIVLVSHDRHLIGLVCDTFWRVAGGKVEEFDGDLDAYAAWLRGRNGENDTDAKKPSVRSAAKTGPAPRKAIDPTVSRRIKRIEARLEEIRVAREVVEAELGDPMLYENAGAQRIAELGFQQAQLAREQDELESEWLELA
ncbi:ATP-binding cassette domain-containing protein [Xanthomonadaceae bacterium XH05]|nr:ATP-binding cassette domain-containing protein [Xanthomonadaceae bacterium XH05]